MLLFNSVSIALRPLLLIALLFLAFGIQLTWAEQAAVSEQPEQFKTVQLSSFIDNNQISLRMVEKKQRVMLPPSTIQFDATLMAPPQSGQFSLVYDALKLWGAGEMPEIDHSAFIGTKDGRVIAVYVSKEAAQQLKTLPHTTLSRFYAVHIYNYAKGPRLIIIGAETL